VRLFVYGTLKTGMCRNAALAKASKLLLPDASVSGYLVNLGSFPGLFAEDSSVAQGELWEINDETLQSLDWIEGHPHFFERRPVVERSTGEEVISYFFNSPETYSIDRGGVYNWDDQKGVTIEWN